MGDLGSIPGLGRFPGERNSYALQYSVLEKSVDCIVHREANSWARLSDFHFHYRYVHSIPHHNNVTSGITYVKAITMFSTLQSSTTLGSSKKIFYWKLKVNQSCPTLCDPMDYPVRGILQARILEWVAFPFSRGSSQPRDQTQVSHIASGFFPS